MKKDIYLISTFRHEWNRSFNLLIERRLEEVGFKGYFAHRDTNQSGTPLEIFEQDLAGIISCKAVLAIAENESPNWGAEIGFAYARQMPVLALAQQDHHIPLITNGMITKCLRVNDLNKIDDYIDELAKMIKAYL